MDTEFEVFVVTDNVRGAAWAAAIAARVGGKQVYIAGQWDWETGPATSFDAVPWGFTAEFEAEEEMLWTPAGGLVPYEGRACFIVM